MYVTEATQFCVTAGSTLILKSVQSRELGQTGKVFANPVFWYSIKGIEYALGFNFN